MIEVDAATVARQRAATYWLLSRLVLEPPDAKLLAELRFTLGAPVDGQSPLACEVADLTSAIHAEQATRLDLRVEHTRLWGGISQDYGPPPPFESVIREQRLPGDATTAVAAFYKEAGLAAHIEEAGPPDHLASELKFMALCAMREAAAWEGERDEEALDWQDRQAGFLEQHLLAWAPAHCAQVAGTARTDYHRAAASLLAGALRLDAGAGLNAKGLTPAA
jgi:TorA maturation chaperone TorD